MRILIITPYADPEKGACVVRVNAFRYYFTARSHSVEVYAPQRGGVVAAEGITRYPGISGLVRLMLSNRFDAIIGTSPPLTHSFFGLLMAKLTGAAFILDAKDPFTRMLTNQDPSRKGTAKIMAFEAMERICHRLADRVVFLIRPNMLDAERKYSLAPSKLLVAQNGSDTAAIQFDAQQRVKVRKELGIGRRTAVLYLGSIGDKDLGGFVKSALPKIAKGGNAMAAFILSYEGTLRQDEIIQEMKKSLVENKIVDRAVFLFNVDFRELYKYLSAADAGLIAYPDFGIEVVSGKVFDYIAAGLPVVAKDSKKNFILKDFIESHSIGFLTDNWDDFNSRFIGLFGRKNRFAKQRGRIALLARKNSRDECCRKVLRAIEGAVAAGKGPAKV